jgi:hypothetical protein
MWRREYPDIWKTAVQVDRFLVGLVCWRGVSLKERLEAVVSIVSIADRSAAASLILAWMRKLTDEELERELFPNKRKRRAGKSKRRKH